MNDIFLEFLIKKINSIEEILDDIKGYTRSNFIFDSIEEIDKQLWQIVDYYKEVKSDK